MTILQQLSHLGFTEYEGKAYIAVLQNPDSTGYEISQASGVPRSKIYEAMEALLRKNAVSSFSDNKRLLYRAIPSNMLLQRHKEKTAELLQTLKPALHALESPVSESSMTKITGSENIIETARFLLKNAKQKVFLSGFPDDIQALSNDLKDCTSRGVECYIVCYGAFHIDKVPIYEHEVTALQYLQVAALGRWLALSSDYHDMLSAQISYGEQSNALRTSQPMLVFSMESWISHDISLLKINKTLQSKLDSNIYKDLCKTMDSLQSMWILHEEADKNCSVCGKTESLQTLFSRIGQNLKGCSPEECYLEFRIKDGTEETWYVSLFSGTSTQERQSAVLSIRMRKEDFSLLMAGQLPRSVFMTPQRIQIQGDLAYAPYLQHIKHSL